MTVALVVPKFETSLINMSVTLWITTAIHLDTPIRMPGTRSCFPRIARAFRRDYHDGIYSRTKPRGERCTQPGGFVDGIGSSIVNHIDNMQTSFCRRAMLQRILDIYLSEQENPDGSLKFKDRTMLNNRLNS